MADDSIVAEYRLNVAATQKALADINARLGQVENQGKKSAQGVENAFVKMGDNLANQFKQIGSTIAGAFAVERLASFAKEAVELAGKVEGVQIAFNRLNRPQLLDELRKATKGTVSDLNLMTAAVRASNFKIPMEQMGSLLEFARRRAKETGESIDYLVESIVVGIGRKSPLILDNLGISAVELSKRFNGISVEAAEIGDIAKIVGDIAREELEKMGVEAETTGDSIAQMGAFVDNLKVKFGDLAIDALKFFKILKDNAPDNENNPLGVSDAVRAQWGKWSAEAMAAGLDVKTQLESVTNGLKTMEEARSDVAKKRANLESELIKRTSGEQAKAEELRLIMARRRFDEAKETNLVDYFAAKTNLENVEKEIAANKGRTAELKAALEIYKQMDQQKAKANDADNQTIRNVAFLRAAIKDLTDTQENEATSVERVKEITQELIPLRAELDALLGKSNTTTEDAAKKLKELKERLGDVTEMLLKMPEGFRQFAVDVNGVGNSLNTLNEMLSQAQKQMNEAPLFSDAFKQAEADVERLKMAIKEAMGEMQIDVSRGYQGITSGIKEESDDQLEIIRKKQSEEKQIREDGFAIAYTLVGGWLDMVTRANQYELVSLENALNAGQITREKYDKERKRLMREQAENQKSAALLNAIVSTAAAVATALTAGPVSGQILAALTAALGAVQIGIIASEPIPQFAKGGWVDGKPHSLGGTKIEAEKGEFIINRKAAAKHAPLIEAINDDRIPEPQQGWDNLMQSIKMQSMFNDRNMIAAIDRHREADTKLLHMIANKLNANGLKRGGYA